ncbi:restriction endonuclease subunit S [Proteus mirabilis]|uniref:restriction endonuclease subunit S n=1 Tax=Proteus TaxID=583 RepID=UPI001C5CE0B3|nr:MULTISPECIES: restriction endonuclease subunit S [Proteus]MCT0130208.1 restriction endonuclease subunit S [Proteus mirabilis]
MSKLSYLENLLDGVEVEWMPLTSLCSLITTGKLNANAMEDNGAYPFFTCNEEPYKINTYAFDLEAILISGNGSLVGHLNYYKGKFNAYQRTYILGGFNNNTNIMYLYYYLKHTLKPYIHKNSRKGSVPYITMPMLENFLFPIPCPNNPEKSLAIQSEIVRILDKFTAITAELTAELTTRKKQYNYYRDQLLSFDEGKVEWKMLGDVAQYSKTRIGFEQLDETNYVGVDNLLQNRAGKTLSSHVPTSGKFTEFRKNDILIGNIRPYLKKIWQSDCIGGTNGDVLAIRCVDSSINPRYLYQVLADDKFFEYNMQHAKGAKMPRGSKDDILKYSIPIPSLIEQARIVAVLDKFDTLINSISEGLPREIELRQKQYEYYRDLLFNFPKPVTN